MSVGALCALGVCAAIMAAAIREIKPEYARLLSLAAGVMITGAAVSMAAEFIDGLGEFARLSPTAGVFLKPLLKITGIAYIAQFSAELCRDAGEEALGGRVELAGKTAIALMSFPIIKEVFINLMRIIE